MSKDENEQQVRKDILSRQHEQLQWTPEYQRLVGTPQPAEMGLVVGRSLIELDMRNAQLAARVAYLEQGLKLTMTKLTELMERLKKLDAPTE